MNAIPHCLPFKSESTSIYCYFRRYRCAQTLASSLHRCTDIVQQFWGGQSSMESLYLDIRKLYSATNKFVNETDKKSTILFYESESKVLIRSDFTFNDCPNMLLRKSEEKGGRRRGGETERERSIFTSVYCWWSVPRRNDRKEFSTKEERTSPSGESRRRRAQPYFLVRYHIAHDNSDLAREERVGVVAKLVPARAMHEICDASVTLLASRALTAFENFTDSPIIFPGHSGKYREENSADISLFLPFSIKRVAVADCRRLKKKKFRRAANCRERIWLASAISRACKASELVECKNGARYSCGKSSLPWTFLYGDSVRGVTISTRGK